MGKHGSTWRHTKNTEISSQQQMAATKRFCVFSCRGMAGSDSQFKLILQTMGWVIGGKTVET